MAKRGSRELAAALRRAGSAAALARELGVAPSTVRRWKVRLPAARLDQVAAWTSAARATPRARAPGARELAVELRKAGSPKALAARLGVTAGTVRRWAAKGLTDRGRAALAELRSFERAEVPEKKAAQAERAKFLDLLEAAGRKVELPTMPTTEGVREGYVTKGYRWTQAYERQLTYDLVDKAATALVKSSQSKKASGEYWQIFAKVIQFDPTKRQEKLYGYMRGVVQLTPGDAGDYVVFTEVVTPRNRDFSRTLEKFKGILLDIIDAGFMAYLVGTTLFNYDLRTVEERKQWSTKTRKARRKKKPKTASKKS